MDFVRDKIATKRTMDKDEIAIFSKLELMDPIRSLESYHLEHDSQVKFEIGEWQTGSSASRLVADGPVGGATDGQQITAPLPPLLKRVNDDHDNVRAKL